MQADSTDRERRAAYKLIATAGYEVVTYITFTKMIREEYLQASPPNMHALKSKFMNSVVWVDEAHNVALTPVQLVNKKSRVKEDTYWTLHKLFHCIERMTIILSTTTPMLNQAGEITITARPNTSQQLELASHRRLHFPIQIRRRQKEPEQRYLACKLCRAVLRGADESQS